jgi:hypothetical protein
MKWQNAVARRLDMRVLCVVAASVLLCTSPGLLRGDCLVRVLPKDGGWATFHVAEKWDDGTESSFYITIKAVGGAMIDDMPCRWIELKFQSDEGKSKGLGSTWKFLIPEEHLGLHSDPLKNAVKTWHKSRDGEIREARDAVSPRLHLFISPEIKNLKKSDRQSTIDWQGGQLACDVIEGSNRSEFKVETRYHLSLHEKVPFGVAAARLEIVDRDGSTGTVNLGITEYGFDGTSDLPDVK